MNFLSTTGLYMTSLNDNALAGLSLAMSGFGSAFQQAAPSPRMKSVPISRVGELSYLPLNVSGSFEGATMNFEMRRYPGFVENDGTYVFLRNGTTGSVMGVYYAYVKNAVSGALTTPVRTNFRYQPSYFPAGTTARYVMRSDGQCILGRLQSSAGVLGDYFVSLTNGTFDATKHVGAVIPAANFPTLNDSTSNIEAFVGDTNLYIVVTSSGSNISVPVEFALYSIPLSNIKVAGGGNVLPTQITGWTTTGFGGTFAGLTNIRVANKQLSTQASDLPIVVYPASPSAGWGAFTDNDTNINTDSAQDASTGNIRIRVTGTSVSTVGSTGISTLAPISFWINVNPVAKTAALEGPATTPGSASYDSAGGKMVFSGGMFPATAEGYLPGDYQGGGGTWTWSPGGYWFGVRDSDPPDYDANVYKAQCSSFYPSRYEALAPSATVTGNATVSFMPMYGSALGGRMLGVWPLPDSYMLAASYGPKQDKSYEWGPVLVQPGPFFIAGEYQSQYNGLLDGFPPSVLRTRVSDMGLSNDTFTSLISEIAANGVVTTSGGRFLDGYNTIAPQTVSVVNNVLQQGGGTILLPQIVSDQLKTAAWSALGISEPPASNVEVFVPQNTAIPLFALLTWTDASKNVWVSLLELSITSGSRTGQISSLAIVSNSPAQSTDTGTTIFPLNDSLLWTSGACTIYEGSDAYFVGFLSKVYLSTPGSGSAHNVRFAIPKSTNRPDWTTRNIQLQGGTYNVSYYTGWVSMGFGECDQNPTGSDNYTKIILNVKCTTLAQYNAWSTIKTGVLTSQDVAQGWLVYFTDNVPVLLNGVSFTVAPTTIDLSSIKSDPSNTTFYVYVQVVAGVCSYLITPTQQAESPTMMYLGTVITGASGITSINVKKVTRLDNYRLSTAKQGSSISVSPGTPDTAQHLNWTT